ncbi:MAG: hypothetical protein U0232_10750 [Thermomicrobiales bacterium]
MAFIGIEQVKGIEELSALGDAELATAQRFEKRSGDFERTVRLSPAHLPHRSVAPGHSAQVGRRDPRAHPRAHVQPTRDVPGCRPRILIGIAGLSTSFPVDNLDLKLGLSIKMELATCLNRHGQPSLGRSSLPDAARALLPLDPFLVKVQT